MDHLASLLLPGGKVGKGEHSLCKRVRASVQTRKKQGGYFRAKGRRMERPGKLPARLIVEEVLERAVDDQVKSKLVLLG